MAQVYFPARDSLAEGFAKRVVTQDRTVEFGIMEKLSVEMTIHFSTFMSQGFVATLSFASLASCHMLARAG